MRTGRLKNSPRWNRRIRKRSLSSAHSAWSGLKRISKSEIQRGDLLINHTHMAIALSPTQAIGQQNTRRNVSTGSFEAIMMNTGPWSAYRYVGASTGERSAAV